MSNGADLSTYYFLPTVRQGLANSITGVENGRSTVMITPEVRAWKTNGDLEKPDEKDFTMPDPDGEGESTKLPWPKPMKAQLYGPGDVLGFDPRIVVRTDPAPNTRNAEPNYFPAIEFADVDFVWRFSPGMAYKADLEFAWTSSSWKESGKLAPWIALIVLVADSLEETVAPEFEECKRDVQNPHLPPSIKVTWQDSLPNLAESWGWAHAQMTAESGLDDPELRKALQEPGRGVCRLICTRRLHARTRYTAFVVPTYKLGVQAGLGDKFDDTGNELTLPYYYRWEFSTGPRGDFEYLVSALKPRALTSVGFRNIDCSQPGFGINEDGTQLLLGMEGALQPTGDSLCTKWGLDDPNSENEGKRYRKKLAEKIGDAKQVEDGFPVVLPPLYGRWHKKRSSVVATNKDWFDELNLDPRHRSAAGLGAEVVRQQQESLMAAAWNQLGAIEDANEMLRHAQLGREVSDRTHTRLQELPEGSRLSVLSPPLAKPGENWTLSNGLLDPAYRHIARPRGPAKRRAATTQQKTRGDGGLTLLELGQVNPAGPRPRPPIGTVRLGDFAAYCKDYQLPKIEVSEPNFTADEVEGSVTKEKVEGAVELNVIISGSGSITIRSVEAKGDYVSSFFGEWEEGEIEAPSTCPVKLDIIFKLEEDDWVDNEYLGSYASFTVPIEIDTDHPLDPKIEMTLTIMLHLDEPEQKGTENKPSGTGSATPSINVLSSLNFVDQRVASSTTRPAILAESKVVEKVSAHFTPQQTQLKRVADLLRPASILIERTLKELEPLDPIVWAPEFRSAMVRPLSDLGNHYALPGVETIPQNTVSLLQPNRRFIESYMCGLNHEFARELLWRGYPTDQRGTYFRQFWDVTEYMPTVDDMEQGIPKIVDWLCECEEHRGDSGMALILRHEQTFGEFVDTDSDSFKELLQYVHEANNEEINKWIENVPLHNEGEEELRREQLRNVFRQIYLEERLRDIAPIDLWKEEDDGKEKVRLGYNRENTIDKTIRESVILAIRGELFWRYPDTIVYAVEKPKNGALPKIRESNPVTATYSAVLPPDLVLLGFPFSVESESEQKPESEAKKSASDYWFVFEERLGNARFGFDENGGPQVGMYWEMYANDNGAARHANSAVFAEERLQLPVRVFVDADHLLPKLVP